MNQGLEYVLIFAATGVLFAGVYAAATSDIRMHGESLQDRYETYKARMQEIIILIDAPTRDPVSVELVNAGIPVNITGVFVNGTPAVPFAIYDTDHTEITKTMIDSGVIIRVDTTVSYPYDVISDNRTFASVPVAILTERGSIFRFG